MTAGRSASCKATVHRMMPPVGGQAGERFEDGSPLVSVVIVSFNGRQHLERCLPALAATTGVEFETTLADNGSSDGTAGWVRDRFPTIRALELGHNLGFGAANACGIAAARAPLIALLNSDTVVEPGWLAELVRVLDGDPTIAAVCSTLRLLDHPELLNARGGGMSRLGFGFDRDYLHPAAPSPLAPEPETREVLFPTAAAMLIRREDFAAAGGFDPAMFMYHEDVDLGWRLWLAGRRVVACRDSVVVHALGGSAHAGRSRAWKERLGARHNLRSLLVCYQARPLLGALLGLARLWLRHRAVGRALGATAWNLAHLPGTLLRRWRVQRGRAIDDASLVERGLVSPAALNPAPPELPRPGVDGDRIDLLVSPVLRPGHHAALGRLGPGWHPRRRDADGWWRWTCGDARCRLRVAPGAAGTLVVSASLAQTPAGEGTVLVSCNGVAARAQLPASGWHEVALPVEADAHGRLEVRICSPAWERDNSSPVGNPCRIGCAVREVRFEPEIPMARPVYSSVSVIVPTYNRSEMLRETLAALAAQTCRDLEVIVVDDGATDGTWEMLTAWQRENAARLRLTPLHQENLKPGRARNLGLRHASGDLVLFIGDDIVPAPELVAEHLARHNQLGAEAAVLGFTDWHRERVRVTPFLELINRDGQQFSYGHFAAGEEMLYTCFYTSNISLPRRLLGDDPFHPAFTFVDWEDIELGYRLSLRGLPIVYHPKAAARHVHPMTMASFYRRQQHVGRTVDVLLELHPELAGDDAMPPLEPARWHPLVRYPVRTLLPLLSAWDRLGLRLPLRVYRLVLLAAFFDGRVQGWHPEAGT
jgi:GT2 family glycosyltransferase